MHTTRQDFEQYLCQTYAPAPFVPVSGKGAYLVDDEGRRYLDLTGGIAVNAFGHAPDFLIDALTKQAKQLWHVSNCFTNAPALALARTLVSRTFANRVFFCNSGAEANEAALKLARKHGRARGATKILSFAKSFHGRTLFTVATGGQPKYSKDFAPLPASIEHLPLGDVAAFDAAMDRSVCAVIIEPILGEGGVVPVDCDFLQHVRHACDAQGALLIFDEVQTGMGRTGHLFAYEATGVTPDVLTSAKGLGGGFPIGAMLCGIRAADVFGVGDHGTTFGGNPLACACALAVLEKIDQTLLDNVRAASETLRAALSALPIIKEVRGKGLLLGAVLADAHADKALHFVKCAQEEGLLVLNAGNNVIRLAPPLNIQKEELKTAWTLLQKASARFLAD